MFRFAMRLRAGFSNIIIVCTASNKMSCDPHTRCLTVVLCAVTIATVVIVMHLYKDHTIIIICIIISTVYPTSQEHVERHEIHTIKYVHYYIM